MRKILLAALLATAMPALAQAPVQAQEKATVVSADAVEKLSAAAAATQTGANPRPNALQRIIAAGPYALSLEHRIAKAPAAIHQTEAEVMFVLGGAATLTTGGTLVNAGAARGGNINGDDITGGTPRHIAKGDVLIVAEMVPHLLVPDAGAPLVLATLHVPRNGAPAPAPAGGRGPAAEKVYNAASDLPAMIARAKAALPAALAAGRMFTGETLLSLPPYRMGLEFRSDKGTPSLHKNDGELMYVLEGEGTIVTDGQLVGAHDTNPANSEGTSIAGGTQNHMKKGDFIYVPQGVPHQGFTTPGGTFVLATLHVPAPK